MNIRNIYIKLIIIASLSICIVLGLIYLASNERIHHNTADNTEPSATAEISSAPLITASVEPSPSVSPTAVTTEEPEQADVTSDHSLTRIVNRNHRIDESYIPADLRVVNVNQYGSQQLRNEAAEAMENMFAAAQKDGISLYLISGYRSYSEQLSLYYTYEARYGREYADSIDDRAGESEHQLGLAADIGSADHTCELDGCFVDTSAYQWLEQHAAEYGYIERYPQGKEEITSVAGSPWNFRYVGISEAENISKSGLTMEEYYNWV